MVIYHLTKTHLASIINWCVGFSIISPIDDFPVINEHNDVGAILYQPEFLDLFRPGRYSFLTLLCEDMMHLLVW